MRCHPPTRGRDVTEGAGEGEDSDGQDRTDLREGRVGIQVTCKTLRSLLVTLVLGSGDEEGVLLSTDVLHHDGRHRSGTSNKVPL